MRLTVSVPDDFNFRNAVCSHGFFVLAPNRWDPGRQALRTVITTDETTAVAVTIRERKDALLVESRTAATPPQRAAIRSAVRRMLRITEDLRGFHAMCARRPSHRDAARQRFGRLLRGASVFEDVIKVICTCNVTWRQTVRMIDLIVAHWGVSTPCSTAQGFPTARRLADVDPGELRARAKVGYRAEYIHDVARQVASGALDLNRYETYAGPTEPLYRELRKIRGIGDYAAGHLCMLLGRYDRLAIDSETLRFVRQRHPRRDWSPASIRRFYASWQPFQFLAYWYELWMGYVDRHGPAETWDRSAAGLAITEPPQP